MPLVIRLLTFLGRNWKFIAISLGLVATSHFVFSESWGQALQTLERFVWLIILCVSLLAVGRYFAWKKARELRMQNHDKS